MNKFSNTSPVNLAEREKNTGRLKFNILKRFAIFVKSNALTGLSLGTNANSLPYGRASFSGKATYLEPGWISAVGNYSFIAYVEDNNEPGSGVDWFWIEVKNPNGTRVEAISVLKPATVNAEYLLGGNIVVPHTCGKQLLGNR